MKKFLKYILTVLLVIATISGIAVSCFAAQNKGSVVVTLEDEEKNRINGIEIHLCQIALLNSTGYYPTAPFESSGISVSGIVNRPDDLAARSVLSFVKENGIGSVSKTTENGTVSFTDLDLGIWLVYGQEGENYTFSPYLVFLPYESGGKLFYQVSSSPKTEENAKKQISISVIKKWDDRNNAAGKRPSTVLVELLNGEAVVDKAVLSEENGWSHLFQNLPGEGEYFVREEALSDYKATYSGDAENGFVITNTFVGEKLPQTGQYWWPIILIAVAGTAFVLLGVYETLVKKNEKKK